MFDLFFYLHGWTHQKLQIGRVGWMNMLDVFGRPGPTQIFPPHPVLGCLIARVSYFDHAHLILKMALSLSS